MRNTTRQNPTGFRFWVIVWGLGLAGQLCWNVENQWFNTFVYAKIAKDSNIVTAMVIISALVTTLSTFFFGTLSDRLGSRKRFVSFGYIVWGVFTILFGLTEFIGKSGMAGSILFIASVVVAADAVMSFFGSMGNDAGYNAWTNDNTTDANRGQIGAALAVQPVIGTIAGTVAGGMLIGADNNYQRLFWAMGLFVIVMGLLGLVCMKDAPGLAPHKAGSFRRQFGSVFHFKNFIKQKELALACLAVILFFIPFNVYFVHIGNWMIYGLGFTADKMGYVEGAGLLLATFLSIPAATVINKKKIPLVVFASIVINIAGLFLIYFLVDHESVDTVNLLSAANLPMFAGIFLSGAGYILVTQSAMMWIKSLYPGDSRGQFEGIRVMSFTLIPMIIGTWIGNVVVKTGEGTRVNEFGITENIPTETIFLCAALLLFACFAPLYFGSKLYYKRVNNGARHEPA